MLTFQRQKIKDIVIANPDKIARNCTSYEIKSHDFLVAKVYGGDCFSFIEFSDMVLRIDRKREIFRESQYLMHNNETEEFIGKYRFTKGIDECILELSNGDILFFSKIDLGYRPFKPSTWNDFEFKMSYKAENISYEGRLLKNDVFEGTINTTNENSMFSITAGIFFIEERFRLVYENSG